MTEPLLSLRHLVVAFDTDEGYLRAVDDVSFDVAPSKTLGIVGESGCGKSVTSLAMMRLIPSPPGFIERGEAWFEGRDLLRISEPEMRKLRGDEISMIFQEPMTSLNPVYTVGSQIIEAIRLHRNVSRRAARARAIELLDLVGIPAPSERIDSYPHTLSGGMRQRAMIAMALACDPRLLIADEPTTALDVTIQAQILDLLRSLQAELGMSIIFISHDLGVMAEFAHEIVVMYAGRVVERAETHELFRNPRHPYTRGLLQSLPSVRSRGHRLQTIPGIVPDMRTLPPGCRFRDRCSFAREDCGADEPQLRRVERSEVACFYAELI
ncbi:MAG: peptide ABC transporter ATP-binding protein [Myxococcales bacterium SG8_38]|nr:MAG: peptide ABC transporter ATP-binding protein [Myxococcales bacterium SG8_38]